MEVHHHPHLASGETHTPGKKWTHYFWEFFMLFLAVTAGFFVENQREHYIEHKREKQFIISMINELEADTLQLHKVMKDSVRIKGLNDLLDLIYAGNGKTIDVREAHYLVAKNAMSVTFMNFSSSTLSQLKNSGNMRLIRNRSAVDSFNTMDNQITLIERQQNNVLASIFNAQDYSTMIFNAKYFREGGRLNTAEKIRKDAALPALMTQDANILITYANKISIQTARLTAYHGSLNKYDKLAIRLITYLKKEYQLE
jgi:hypothetical protein